MQVALFGGSCAGKTHFSALLSKTFKAAGIAAEVAMPSAVTAQLKGDVILLMGLEDAHTEDVDEDIALRQLLARHHLPYQVLYGAPQQCLEQVLNLISSRFDLQDPRPQDRILPAKRAESMRPWVWSCDKCSDPQCEHRLLTGLLASRPATPTEQLP